MPIRGRHPAGGHRARAAAPGRAPSPTGCICKARDIRVYADGARLFCGSCQGALDPVRTAVWLSRCAEVLKTKLEDAQQELSRTRDDGARRLVTSLLDDSRASWKSPQGGPWHRTDRRNSKGRWVYSICGQQSHRDAVTFAGPGQLDSCPACDYWARAQAAS